MFRSWGDARASWPGMRSDDWFVLRVMPGTESVATEFFAKELTGVETYYPVARRKRIVRHAEVIHDSAAFQGYLYAQFETLPNWELIGSFCRANPRLIMRQDVDGELRYLWERNSVIEELRQREANNAFGESDENPFLEKLIGSQVRIPSGLFTGHYAKVHSIHDSIVKVKVWLLGRRSFLSFCFDDLLTEKGHTK